MDRIPFLTLPYLVQKEVVRCFDCLTLFKFSVISKRTLNFVKLIKVNTESVSYIIQDSKLEIHIQNGSKGTYDSLTLSLLPNTQLSYTPEEYVHTWKIDGSPVELCIQGDSPFTARIRFQSKCLKLLENISSYILSFMRFRHFKMFFNRKKTKLNNFFVGNIESQRFISVDITTVRLPYRLDHKNIIKLDTQKLSMNVEEDPLEFGKKLLRLWRREDTKRVEEIRFSNQNVNWIGLLFRLCAKPTVLKPNEIRTRHPSYTGSGAMDIERINDGQQATVIMEPSGMVCLVWNNEHLRAIGRYL
ncbi:hypothetical protein CAEBREN_04045 [Caenorhabditis brenneri]|uniref:F-box domain-containing protein n=1 Tax=Caenorhabditis brenneri TaxID=135651 RepID=G0MJH7_CAEBE|nr:hypothetical protein CAEBREN_04045 [Caenorhabditis brenneri]